MNYQFTSIRITAQQQMLVKMEKWRLSHVAGGMENDATALLNNLAVLQRQNIRYHTTQKLHS